MNESLERIFIVGPSGSGKTTVAKLLSEKLQLPHIDLDDIRYPPSINRTVSYGERIPEISKIANEEKWLVEGIYVNGWVKELLDKSETIIWLDIPLRISLYRISKRFVRQKLTGKDRYGFRSFLKLVRWGIHYHFPSHKYDLSDEDKHITEKKTRNVLDKYKEKVTRIQNKQQLRELINLVYTND